MSLVRAALLLTQTAFNHAATRNPNAAPAKTRYALDTHSLLQLAPLIFKVRSQVDSSIFQSHISHSSNPRSSVYWR
jgi:hypothetical protein